MSAYIVKYFTDLRMPCDTYRWSYNSGTGTGVIPTNDRSHVVFAAMTRDRFVSEARGDIDLAFKTVVAETDGPLASVIGTANTVGATRSWPGVPGHFRKPYGPGWALVGDAGYFKDPFAAHGISDAFRDAELLTDAIVTDSLPAYEKTRDELSMPLFTALESIASYSWDLESLPGVHWELSKAMKQEGAALEALRAPQLVAA